MTNSIYAHTCQSYSEYFQSKVHAGILYRQWMKKGSLCKDNPAFFNARHLYERFCAETDFSPPLLSTVRTYDETTKFLLRTHDGYEIESVKIPMKAHYTLCVSSQVGCRMGCKFCETGRMGLLRNLTPDEIVSQVYVARFGLNFDIHNVVFMGMGEPFDNYDHVMRAIEILTDQNGLALGMQNITVSTSGRIDGIERLMNEKSLKPNLALSLNASNPTLRSDLMPLNRKYSMQALYDAVKAYCEKTKRQVLVAYVLMKDVNDSLTNADELAAYLEGLDIKVNLIPYNAQTVDRFASSVPEKIDAFAERLRQHGLRVLLRNTKGSSIMAACGQLGQVKPRFGSSKW